MGYEVGQKVVIPEGSQYYTQNYPKNPNDIIGIVAGDDREDGWFKVYWSNGEYNNYEDGDLKVLGDTGMDESEIEAWWKECKRGE